MTAHRMALYSSRVSSTLVECHEFPELAGQYDVYGVPKMVVNDTFQFTGGLPEDQFIDTVLEGLAETRI